MKHSDNFALIVSILFVAGLFFLFGSSCQKHKDMSSELEKPAVAAMQPAAHTITDSTVKPDETSVSDSMPIKPAVNTATMSVTADYYTCPMHPQVHLTKPGKCPICGMRLVLGKVSKNKPVTKK